MGGMGTGESYFQSSLLMHIGGWSLQQFEMFEFDRGQHWRQVQRVHDNCGVRGVWVLFLQAASGGDIHPAAQRNIVVAPMGRWLRSKRTLSTNVPGDGHRLRWSLYLQITDVSKDVG